MILLLSLSFCSARLYDTDLGCNIHVFFKFIKMIIHYSDSARIKQSIAFASKVTFGIILLLMTQLNIYAESKSSRNTIAWTANSLMALVASTSTKSYQFTEKKFYSFLKKPTAIHGILLYKKPDVLEKNILSGNKKASYRIVANKLYISKEGKKDRKVLLSNYPEILALANSIRALIAGKIGVLKQFFDIELKGSIERWTLLLTPTDIDLEEKIEFLEIKGVKGNLTQIIIKETDGDKSILTLVAQ
ncbi:hypothetical protein MNBD_GAMMA12-2684 [hydrothermal vent metagenome]|uniref:Outer membrane lipoprotein carrier protein LolA n=1 Tax=hydrothermal vent metagenome TaxID=652676 RepID=A0A3B0YG78_9ZZZZ